MVERIVVKVPVHSFVEVTVTTRTASVPATPVGRARSAASGMMNVKSQTVLAEVVALKAIANVSKASPGLSVKKLTVQTQLVLTMVFVLTEPVFAKKAGKAKVAVSLMKRPGNVCPTVLETVILTWRLNIANVMKVGLVTIVHQNYAILIVDPMDVVRTRLVFANPVGEANDARKKTATSAAAFMGSAKMELAFVSADGTAFTVPWRAVPKAVEATEAARPTSKENGAATVIRVGKDPIVAFGSKPVVTMVMMMTKMA